VKSITIEVLRMNEENLIPMNERTKEEQRKIARQGGIASGKARRERKTLKEELLLLLEKGDTQEKISLAMIKEALDGNTKAFEVIRDTIGEKPEDKLKADINRDITINID
jgi:hypothetical protein